MRACCLWRPKEDTGSLELPLPVVIKSPCKFWEMKPSSLQGLLTIVPSHQLPFLVLFTNTEGPACSSTLSRAKNGTSVKDMSQSLTHERFTLFL